MMIKKIKLFGIVVFTILLGSCDKLWDSYFYADILNKTDKHLYIDYSTISAKDQSIILLPYSKDSISPTIMTYMMEGKVAEFTALEFKEKIDQLDIYYIEGVDTVFLNISPDYYQDISLWNYEYSTDDETSIHRYRLTIE